MSDPTFAEKDPAIVLAEALARYKAETGVTLAPADPRRLHLQTLLLFLAQQRALIDFAGKQNLVQYVSSLWIESLAQLWGLTALPAQPSETTLRWTATTPGVLTIPEGVRATDGSHLWAVVEATTSAPDAEYVDTLARCTVLGTTTNGVAIGQIDTIVDPDPVPAIASVANTTATIGGRDVETLDELRERIRQEPERFAVAGPRGAYQALARLASAAVEDVVALGADDAMSMAGTAPSPGEVRIVVTEVDEDEPSEGLIETIQDALSAEDVRPLTDYVVVQGPEYVNYQIAATYYIARSRSRSAVEIQAAVSAALKDYKAWQRKIGRDRNPSELTARLVAAGAKRVAITHPTYLALKRDEAAKLTSSILAYGGIEDD